MGLLTRLLKRFSCNCASDCHLNDELKELQKFVLKLAEDDLREIYEYFHERENILNEKRREMRYTLRNSIKKHSIII